jgi:hypothetical protein
VIVDADSSPELVLVSPELAARARALLPDRPWEAFAPPWLVAQAGRAAPAGAYDAHATWPARLTAAFPIALLVAFLALLVIGSLPGLGDRPTLGPPAPAQQAPASP